MNKHTPGPWVIGESVKTARLDNALMIRPADHNNYEYGATAIIGTSDADARLIAAAPDMLEALQSLIACDFGSGGWNETAEQAAIKARAAVLKATGEKK